MTGIRTEEARALRWDHVDLDAGSIAVWRSVRHGGDTKTAKSRRTLGLPQAVVDALREHCMQQDEEKAAAELWRDNDLVFTSTVGTELEAANVRRYFRSICRAAGIGEDWAPRGAADQLRQPAVGLRRAGRGDRAAGRPLELPDDGGHLPQGTPPRPGQGRRGHGSDLRLITSEIAGCYAT
jgi:integrase